MVRPPARLPAISTPSLRPSWRLNSSAATARRLTNSSISMPSPTGKRRCLIQGVFFAVPSHPLQRVGFARRHRFRGTLASEFYPSRMGRQAISIWHVLEKNARMDGL